MEQRRVAFARKGMADANISVRECRVGIKIGRAPQTARSLFVPARKHLVNRQDSVGGGVAVIETDRVARGLASARMSLGNTLAPAEHRLEVTRKSKIA